MGTWTGERGEKKGRESREQQKIVYKKNQMSTDRESGREQEYCTNNQYCCPSNK
jgi:hypothetical protein